MKKSRYQNLATEADASPPISYYGLTKAEWYGMTPEQRIVHYNRNCPCEHPFVYHGIEGNVNDERLLDQQSLDPYANTSHSRPHSVELFFQGLCICQTCEGKFGIPRDQDRRKAVDSDVLREKLSPPPGGD